MRYGISTPGGACATDERSVVTELLGVDPEWVLWYEDFASEPPTSGIEVVAASGATPVITWEPWCWQACGEPTPISLPAIAAGDYDDYATRWATALGAAQRSGPVHLRFAHEINGHWYPWSRHTPVDYIAAWRHLYDLFAANGADGVRWMFSPNVVAPDVASPVPWYPGDAYVDTIGVDGYNWGATGPTTRWRDPEQVFAETIAELRSLNADTPMLIAEVGCAPVGGDKAEWVTAFVEYVDADSSLEGFIWFEHDKETDWRIASSPSAAAAMAAALTTEYAI